MDEQVFPQALEAERAYLGGLMTWAMFPEDIGRLSEELEEFDPADFYSTSHRQVFDLMRHLMRQGIAPDTLQVADQITARGIAEDVGGLTYTTSLPEAIPSTENLTYYRDLVREKAQRRRLLEHAANLRKMAHDASEDVTTLLANAEEQFMQLAGWDGGNNGTAVNAADLMQATYEWGERNWSGTQNRVATYWPEFDKKVITLAPGKFVVVAARPAMGKTAFALQLATAAGRESCNPELCGAGFMSLEMPKHELGARIVAQESTIPGMSIITGIGNHNLRQAFSMKTMDLGNELRLWVDDDVGLNLGNFKTRCRKMIAAAGGNLPLIVVDYLQLFPVPEGPENLSARIGKISRMMKLTAMELGICIVALSQLNRGVEQRKDKRPLMSDIRESGNIEQDADLILALYRDEYYDVNTDKPNVAEVIILKQRGGPTGTVELFWNGPQTRFENLRAA